jgi:hypothetical protein
MSAGLITPRQHFVSDIEPPVQQFLDDPSCGWKSRCAAIALASLIPWTFYYLSKAGKFTAAADEVRFREDRIRECEAIRPIVDLADAVRHRELTKRIHARTLLFATEALPDRDRLQLVAKGPMGSQYDGLFLDDIVRDVRDYWDIWIRNNT